MFFLDINLQEKNQFDEFNKEIKDLGLEEEYKQKQDMILDYAIKEQQLKNG